MLPRKNRLKKHTEIDEVFRRGKLWQSPSFSVKFLVYERENEKEPEVRVAFSLGKKYLRRAVDRNRFKRKLSSAIEPYLSRFSQPVDMIFFLQKPSKEANEEALQGELESFCTKLYTSFTQGKK